MPSFDFSSPLYTAHSRRSSKPAPSGPSTPIQSPGFDLMAALQMFAQMATQQQQADLGAQRESQGGIRRDIGGQPIDQTQSGPFGGPITFPSAAERYAEMAKYPLANVPPRTDFASNPYAVGPLPQAPAPTPAAPPPQVGSFVPGDVAGMFDLVGPKDPLSGGGNLLGSVQAGSATAAPPMPGMTRSPAGNMFPTPKPAAQKKKPFSFGGFR